MSESYDVVVVGAGPAGYVAAIRAAQLGKSVACVNDWSDADGKPALGGTCLNVGCIPSKALLDSSEKFNQARHELGDHGIETGEVQLDLKKMMQRKDQVVAGLTQGVAGLFKANKITSIHGRGRLMANKQVEVADPSGKVSTLSAEHVILAVGSVPAEIPPATVDNNVIVDNEGALSLNNVPKRLGIIGAGIIGLELGSVWKRLGSEVTIFEALDDFLPTVDVQLAREAKREFIKSQGLDVLLGTTVTGTKPAKKTVKVQYEDKKGKHEATFDRVIVAVGRKPNTAGIASDDAGLKLDERGFIEVDENCQTGIDGVWAIGDAVRGPMLAHKGSEEGVAVAERIAGQKPHVNYALIPWVIYTHPEIAWVGVTEQQAKEQGLDYKTGFFPFAATGRALAMNEKGGRIKIVTDAKTDEIIGVHIIGPSASELIAEAVVAMEYKASAEDLARTVHAHPTLSEAMHEAAMAVDGRAIHKAN